MGTSINISSENISVFPAVNRNIEQSKDIYSRHTSEEFLAGIVNKLIDKDGFVITEQQDFGSAKPFQFNIHGYYFTVNQLSSIINEFSSLTEGSYLYAYIKVEQHGVWTELAGGDVTTETGNDSDPDTYVYSSLQITDTEPTITSTTTEFVLPILRKTYTGGENWGNTGWFVPSTSYIKFVGKSSYIDTIDGGDMFLE